MENMFVLYLVTVAIRYAGATDIDCWDGCDSTLYSGNISVTSNGLACQPWSQQTPHEHPFGEKIVYMPDRPWTPARHFDHCGDPVYFMLGRFGQPWCYTMDPNILAQPCEIPVCEYTCCYETEKSTMYSGKQRFSKNGHICQFWSSQTPHRHTFTEDRFFPGNETVLEAKNFCRDPDSSGQPWCYVTQGRFRREPCNVNECNRMSYQCGGVLTEESGWISLEPIQNPSVLEMTCAWTIVADAGRVIHMAVQHKGKLQDFSTCIWSIVLYIYDGMSTNDELLMTLCGQREISITSSTSSLFLLAKEVFGTMYTFNATYMQVRAPEPCGGILNKSVGLFGSVTTGSSSLYENNVDCWWNITADQGHISQLVLFDVDIRCITGDYLEIFRGALEVAGKMCPIFFRHTESTDMLALHFHSNNFVTGDGFQAVYSTTKLLQGLDLTAEAVHNYSNGPFKSGTIEKCTCSSIGNCNFKPDLAGERYVITSIFLQNKSECGEELYFSGILSEMNDECLYWNIRTAVNSNIQLIFIDLDILQMTKFQIFDEQDERELLIGSYFGPVLPPIVVSSSNKLVVRLSDYHSYNRYTALFRTVNVNATSSPAWPNGDYSIPMSVYGCSNSEPNQWHTGYLNISFKHQIIVNEMNNRDDTMPRTPVLLGPHGTNSFQLNFCTKVSAKTDGLPDPLWPSGDYSVYGSRNGCPNGFIGENVSRSLPAVQHVNKDGFLPIVEVHTSATNSRIEFMQCRKTAEASTSNAFTESISPFVVLANFQEVFPEKSAHTRAFLSEKLEFEEKGATSSYPFSGFNAYVPTDLDYTIVASSTQMKVGPGMYLPWELGTPDLYFSESQELSPADRFTEQTDRFMYDLGQSVSISVLRIVKAKSPSYMDARVVAVPTVLISEMKWTFLSNGAITCLQSVYRFKHRLDIHCLNAPNAFTGRYLAFLQQDSPILQLILSRTWKVQVVVAKKSKRCNQCLGMDDKTIDDFALKVSSQYSTYESTGARQFDNGWCADPTDANPYLQIDLLLPTSIEGIKIFNWREYKYTETGSYVRNMGVYHFLVQFCIDKLDNDCFRTEKEFHLDRTIPTTTGQMFLFVSAVKARLVKIVLLDEIDSNGLNCLRVELIGCLRSDINRGIFSLGDEYQRTHWFETDYVFMQSYYEHSRTITANSKEECTTLCKEWNPLCNAIVYNTNEGTCIYTFSQKAFTLADFVQIKRDKTVLLAINIYEKENFGTTLYLGQDLRGPEYTTTTLLGLASGDLNFPYYYKRGFLWSWKISNFQINQYQNIIFTNISFNIYENDVEVPADQKRFSDKVDRVYYIRDPSEQIDHVYSTCISTDKETSKCPYITTIDSSFNGKLVHIRSNWQFNTHIILRTWSRDSKILIHGKGFRFYSYSSTERFCSFPAALCTETSAELASPSYLGDLSTTEWLHWTIESHRLAVIDLQFIDFDIGCDTGTRLEISTYGSKANIYCNINKLIRGLKSSSNKITIRYLQLFLEQALLEFFMAKYHIRYLEPYTHTKIEEILLKRLDGNNSSETVGGIPAFKVCSEKFLKCYMYTKLHAGTWSWSMFQNHVCAANGWSLLSVHSKEELKLIGFHVMSSYFDASKIYNSSYLGLVRDKFSETTNEFRWVDNTTVTYTAWLEKNPLLSEGLDCTRVIFDFVNGHSWETISCDEMNKTDFGVCQYTIASSPDSRKDNHVLKNMSRHSYLNISRVTQSNYYRCAEGETISILGVCDGMLDCHDGEDEANCTTDTSNCNKDQFRCGDGTCVTFNVLCDHHLDCKDGSDEDCFFPACGLGMFSCKNQECIDDRLRCDGKYDCIDKSEENSCAQTNCNNGAAFLCGMECIPISFVCDGVADCSDMTDEINCALPKSCYDWWLAGYTEDGVYKIQNVDMECVFRRDNDTGVHAITRYHHIDYDRFVDFEKLQTTELMTKNVILRDQEAVDKFVADFEPFSFPTKGCIQSIDELCTPVTPTFMRVFIQDYALRSLCRCTRGILWLGFTDFYHADCETDPLDADIGKKERYEFIFQFIDIGSAFQTLRSYVESYMIFRTAPTSIRIRINPIVCFAKHNEIQPGLPCGYGYSTSPEVRCLYDLDNYNHIIGCRSLAHLQNCELFDCPENFFKCPKGFCLQNRLVCDGVNQCENGEDELDCDSRICNSEYRCLNSSICLTKSYLCDGHRHCPYGDDERLCKARKHCPRGYISDKQTNATASCPDTCTCYGAMVDCSTSEDAKNHTVANYNSAILSEATLILDLSFNVALIHSINHGENRFNFFIILNISHCEIKDLSMDYFQHMRNLVILDISFNRLTVLHSDMFRNQQRLKILRIEGNLDVLSIESKAFAGLSSMGNLLLSSLRIGMIHKNAFTMAKSEILDLTRNSIETIEDQAFEQLEVLTLLLNGSHVNSFSQHIFKGLETIDLLITDAYVFCCVKPTTLSVDKCFPQKDEFSSCSDLMRNEVLRVMIWLIGLFALTGNVMSLIYRFLYERAKMQLSFGIFVTNLAISDFFMGLYLIIIAGADASYRGEYIFNEQSWRSSYWCNLAGILAFISSESSTFFAALITIDRFIVMKYPFGQVRLSPKMAYLLSAVAWALSLFIAILPLVVTGYFKGEFYSKSGVCLALPLTRDRPPGWMYSILIFIVLNFATFVLIAFGQWLIYKEVQMSKKSMAGKQTKRKQDSAISRNLFLVVATDFLCWFPIGVFGLLAIGDVTIPRDVYAWTAVIVLPINSALNPFLYSLSAILRKQTTTQGTQEKAVAELYTEVGMLKMLDILHEKNLVQKHFDMEDVRVDITDTSIPRAYLACRPVLESKQSKKAANIQVFGTILLKLTQCYDDQLKKPMAAKLLHAVTTKHMTIEKL